MNPTPGTGLIPIVEIFHSIQGEGYFSGTPAVFIRLGGCDVGCHWCDEKNSWDKNNWPFVRVEKIVKETVKYPADIVVITGGEPLMHSLNELTAGLRKAGKRTHLETSGAYPLSGRWDWICLSPKKFMSPHNEIYRKTGELKIIVYNKDDFRWAEEQAKKVSRKCKLFLQPEWSRKKAVLPVIVNYVQKFPEWRVSMQIHKYVQVK
ncbi:MAG: 7-carboxy-7-deazaguanine synthase QueE [Bacteroidetes bacterium]|nr:7-carboxy-7-deazaguanine synthase QueE [Bacteroidota bacterium]